MVHARVPRSLPAVIAGVALLLGACGGKPAGAGPTRPIPSTRTLAAASPAPAPGSASGSGTRTVTVDATGKARAVPDQLVARLAVHATGPTAAGVLSDANARVQTVLDRLTADGVDAKDVRTTQAGLGPTFDNKGHVTGFAADNELEITFRRLATAGRQLDAVVRAPGDAARLESVTLGFNDDDKLLAAARTDGVRRAQAQAEQMVGALGANLGAVRTITESSPSPVYPSAAVSRSIASDAAVPIAPGTQDLTVSVHVVFAIA